MKWDDLRKDLLADMTRWQRIKYHVSFWFESKWLGFRLWLASFEPCKKELLGYTCRHRIMSNGKKECGDE